MGPAVRLLIAVVAAVLLAAGAQGVAGLFGVRLSWLRTIATAVVVAAFLSLAIRPRRVVGFTVD